MTPNLVITQVLRIRRVSTAHVHIPKRPQTGVTWAVPTHQEAQAQNFSPVKRAICRELPFFPPGLRPNFANLTP